MADPIVTPMLIGAGMGAMTSDDPLKGAMMGGALGGFGGSMMGVGANVPAGTMGSGASTLGLNGMGAAATPLGFEGASLAATPLGFNGAGAAGGMELFPAAGLDSMVTAQPGQLGLLGGVEAPSLAPGFAGLGQQSQITLADKLPMLKSMPGSNKGKEMMLGGQAISNMGGKPQQQQVAPPPQPMPIQQRQPKSFAQDAPYQQFGMSPQAFNTTGFIGPRG